MKYKIKITKKRRSENTNTVTVNNPRNSYTINPPPKKSHHHHREGKSQKRTCKALIARRAHSGVAPTTSTVRLRAAATLRTAIYHNCCRLSAAVRFSALRYVAERGRTSSRILSLSRYLPKFDSASKHCLRLLLPPFILILISAALCSVLCVFRINDNRWITAS